MYDRHIENTKNSNNFNHGGSGNWTGSTSLNQNGSLERDQNRCRGIDSHDHEWCQRQSSQKGTQAAHLGKPETRKWREGGQD